MARRIVRWLTPSVSAAALAESQLAAPATSSLAAAHRTAGSSIASVASPTGDTGGKFAASARCMDRLPDFHQKNPRFDRHRESDVFEVRDGGLTNGRAIARAG